MKVLFIYPDIRGKRYGYGHFHRGIAVLSACLKEAGHDTELFHILDKDIDELDVLDRVRESGAQVIGLSVTEVVADFAQEITCLIKSSFPDKIIVVGGVYATLSAEKVINWSGVDSVSIGDGEKSFVDFVNGLGEDSVANNIENFWTKSNEGIVKNSVVGVNYDINGIPLPDRSIFDFPNLYLERKGITTILCSRGCPYYCNYCNNQVMNNNFPRKVVFRDVENVIAEICEVVSQCPKIKRIHFDDDILPLNMEWFREFVHEYKEKVNLPFVCSVRPNLVTDEVASLLKYAGCEEVRMGTESGNNHIRNVVLGRNLSDEQLINAFQTIGRHGIRKYSYNIIGSPDETVETIIDTIKLNSKYDPDYCLVSFCYPFSKTGVETYAKERGLVREDKATDFFDKPSIKTEVSDWQLYYFKLYFRHLVKYYKWLGGLTDKNIQLTNLAEGVLDGLFRKPGYLEPLFKLFTFLGHEANARHRNFARDYLKLC